MRITEDIRAEAEAGMRQMAARFRAAGGEIYPAESKPAAE